MYQLYIKTRKWKLSPNWIHSIYTHIYMLLKHQTSAREKVSTTTKRERKVALKQIHFTFFPPQLVQITSFTSFLLKSMSVSSPISLPTGLSPNLASKLPAQKLKTLILESFKIYTFLQIKLNKTHASFTCKDAFIAQPRLVGGVTSTFLMIWTSKSQRLLLEPEQLEDKE